MTQPANIPFPILNGVVHDWSSIQVKVGSPINQLFLAATSLNYKRTRTRAELRGFHPDPLAKTTGTNAYTADMELPVAEANLLRALLQAQAPGASGYGDVFFSLVVSYSATGFPVITDQILGCTLDEDDASQAKGPEALMRKFNLAPLKIIYNGVDDVTTPLQGAPT